VQGGEDLRARPVKSLVVILDLEICPSCSFLRGPAHRNPRIFFSVSLPFIGWPWNDRRFLETENIGKDDPVIDYRTGSYRREVMMLRLGKLT